MLHTSIVCIKVDVHSFIRAGSSHPMFSKSGRRRLVAGVCQLVYLSLDICDGGVKVEVADTTGAMAAFRLLTNMGSRQATLAAKKAWMQWRTAKRLENSSSWKHRGNTWTHDHEERRKPQAEIKSNSPHESACIYGLRENNQTGNSYHHALFLSDSFSDFFCTGKIMMFLKSLEVTKKCMICWWSEYYSEYTCFKCWRVRKFFLFHRLYNESKKSDLTFASISFVSWFWNRNLILLLPSSDDPFSWENLYLHSTAYNGGLNYAY